MDGAYRLGRGDLVLIAVAVAAVSTSAPLIREADAPALAIAFWRNALAVAVLAPVCAAPAAGRDRPAGPRPRRGGCLLAGVLLSAHFATWVPSLSFTTRGVVGGAGGDPAGVGGAPGPGPGRPGARPRPGWASGWPSAGPCSDRRRRRALRPGPGGRPPRPGRRDPGRGLRHGRGRGPPDGLDDALHDHLLRHRRRGPRPGLPRRRTGLSAASTAAPGLCLLALTAGPQFLGHSRGQPGAAHDERHRRVGGHPVRDRRVDRSSPGPPSGRPRRPAPTRRRCSSPPASSSSSWPAAPGPDRSRPAVD